MELIVMNASRSLLGKGSCKNPVSTAACTRSGPCPGTSSTHQEVSVEMGKRTTFSFKGLASSF